MGKYFKDRDFLAAIFFLIFDAVYLGVGVQIPVSDSSSVGAGFMPRVYGIVMLVVALILLVTSIVRVNKRSEKERAEIAASMAIDKKDALRMLIGFAAILLYVILLTRVGFIPCSIPLLFLLVLLLTPQHVVDDYVKHNCCDAEGKLRAECVNAKGKVRFQCMLKYYGKVLLFAVVFTMAVYALFNYALGLRMPQGVLKNILP